MCSFSVDRKMLTELQNAAPSAEATYRRPASGASRSFSSTRWRLRQLRMPLSTLPAPSTAICSSFALPDVSQHPQLNSATPSPFPRLVSPFPRLVSPFPRLVSPRSSPSPASPRPSQALRQRIAVSQAAESGSTSLRMSQAFATPSARVDTCAVCSSSPPSAVPSREATYRRPASEGIVSVSPSVDRTHRCLHRHPPAHTPARLVCSRCIYSCLVVRLSL